MSLEEFRRKYPAQTMTLGNGKPFAYRYYRNSKAAAAVVLLTGGIGLSDLFYRHFEWFAGDFSVLTFDYQIQFADNGEFSDAVAELLCRLKEKAWLVGQSLGGVVAQVIAARHPEVVELSLIHISLIHLPTTAEYILIPLILRTTKVAEELSASMTVRGVRFSGETVSYRSIRFCWKDAALLALLLAVACTVLLLERGGVL